MALTQIPHHQQEHGRHVAPRGPLHEHEHPLLPYVVIFQPQGVLVALSGSASLSLGGCTSAEGGRFSRFGKSARHGLRPPRRAPIADMAVERSRAPASPPPPVDCWGSLPLLGHLICGRATPIFQIWKIGPDIAAAALAARPRPPMTSPTSTHPRRHPRRRPRPHRLLVVDQCHGPWPRSMTLGGGESEKRVRATQNSEHRPRTVATSDVMMAKSVAGHWGAAAAAGPEGGTMAAGSSLYDELMKPYF